MACLVAIGAIFISAGAWLLSPTRDPLEGCPALVGQYTPRAMALCANRFITMGEERAFSTLIRVANRSPHDLRLYMIACALYDSKVGKPLRLPGLGITLYGFQGSNQDDWPNLPLYISQDVLFCAPFRISLAGVGESGREYLVYRRATGTFHLSLYKVATEAAEKEALRALHSSGRWKKLIETNANNPAQSTCKPAPDR